MATSRDSAESWVTLATNDSYALGAMVLTSSLKRVGTTRQLAILVTPGVTRSMRDLLNAQFDVVTEVDVLDSEDATNLALLTRPELGITFTKIQCWKLVQFTKCVFLDADTLVIQNCDELFEREEFSAAPDAGWPDCFNSGVFVFRPSLETYLSLLTLAIEKGSFDGGDQGLLNSFFKDWSVSHISRHLPFVYNMVASAVYSYAPAYRTYGSEVKIAHFIGPSKPWLQHFDSGTGKVQPSAGQEQIQALLQTWWDIFKTDVHPKLVPEMFGIERTTDAEKGLAGAYAQIPLEGPETPEQLELLDSVRKDSWEQGKIDYLGKDSFDNIMKKIQQTMAETALRQQSASSATSSGKASPAPPAPEETADQAALP